MSDTALRKTLSAPARGTIQLVIARCCFMLSGYVISVILARGLGPAAYGIYGVVLSMLLWIEMIGNGGITGAFVQLLPSHGRRAAEVEQTARGLLLIIAFILFAVCWALAGPVARLFDIPAGSLLWRLAILDLPFNGLYLAYQGLLYGQRRFAVMSIAIVIYSLTKLAATLFLVALGLSIAGALIVNVLATVGVLVYLTIKMPPRGWVPVRDLVPVIVRIGVPMGIYLMILQVLVSLDLWFLKSLWAGTGDVIGFYVAALNIARLPMFVPSVIIGVMFASVSWALSQSDDALARRYVQGAVRFACVVLVPSCVLIVLYAQPIMALLYSDAYAAGSIYLQLQIIAFGGMAFLDVFLHALMTKNKHYVSVGILLALIPVSVLANIVLIPKFGATGAAVSLLVTISLGTLVSTAVVYRHFGPLVSPATIYRVGAAATCMALSGSLIELPDRLFLLEMIILFAVYGLLLLAMKEVRISELRGFSILKSG